MSFTGSHSSPSNSQNNVPSPATFAKMAAAVGVHNPLLDDPRRASANSTEIVAPKPQDSYAEMLSHVDNFLNVQLNQLEKSGNIFFDRFENALDEGSDSNKIVEAHSAMIALYDQLISSATQLGLAALPCPVPESPTAKAASTIDELNARLSSETKETFERRERLREGVSIVTSILTQNR